MAKDSSRWRSFDEARTLARTLGLKTQKAYENWARETGHTLQMPGSPHKMYEDFTSYPDFLNYDATPKKKLTNHANVLPFAEARAFMHQLGLKSQRAFDAWCRDSRPEFIPASPRDFYKEEWTSIDDFLGYKKSYRPFLEAREFARSKGFRSRREWTQFAASPEFPADIPAHPARPYTGQGWSDWGDFLGFHSKWTDKGIISFLDSLKPCIADLTELDLYLILSKNGMLERGSGLRGKKILVALKHAQTVEELEALKRQLVEEVRQLQRKVRDVKDGIDQDSGKDDADEEASLTKRETDPGTSLRKLDILESLKAVDRVVALKVTDDQEVLTFMVNERIALLWHEAMASGESVVFDRLRELPQGEYANRIRDGFAEEFQNVAALPMPDGYKSVDARSKPVSLNLMQRLTAYRLLHESRLGNWSGVGAGKTNAAVFAAAVIDAKMTLILAANSTVSSWKKTIRRAFESDAIHVHDQKPMEFKFRDGSRNFLVVNYESFQLEWTADFIELVANQSQIDFIVFDEVQFARQRYEAPSRISNRRKHVDSLIRAAFAENPDLRILAMSATPVVNNLLEAVKVLELIHPDKDFSKIPVGASVANAIGVHLLVRKYGIRYVPRYDLQLVKRTVAIDGQEWLDRLVGVQARDILQMERTLLEVKLRHLRDWVRRGTLIYTYYVDGIVEPLAKAVENLGLKVHRFTGEDRVTVDDFVKDFNENRADVLIGSAPVGTGVDGLQFVLDRIVFITLPWSHAEYDQIVGRLWRQGSAFQSVDVIVPQVTLRQERVGQWSWDDQRLRCIEYKQTLADAALDGVIPQGNLPSREEMQRRSLEALKVWADNVSRESSAIETQPGEIIK